MIAPIARCLVASVCGALAAAQVNAAAAPVRYTCPGKPDLTVERGASVARVSFAGRTYELQRHRSDIGAKYLSKTAALIIDGASAVFVADEHPNIGTCVQAVPIASARQPESVGGTKLDR